jgi:Tol biopolymer transport system component/DNA-binding winged helix-turn-helix (wHTH) protein
MSSLINHYYRFGEFTLDADQRILLREGKPLALAPKVFDTLLILVENSGRIVTKEELMSRLWPDTFVEEGNLPYNIKQLRKSLGDDVRRPYYIETVARRGYRFIARVEEVLSDMGEMSGRIAQRFETSDALPPDAGKGLNRPAEAQASGPAAESAKESRPAIAESILDASPASDRASARGSKNSVALRVALIVVLAVVGLVYWKFSSGPNHLSGESNKVDIKTRAVFPLKLERLTGTGQSRQVAISPDGKYVAYTRSFEKKSSIWLRHLAANTNIEIVPARGTIYGLAFTHSGEYLYFMRGDPTTALYRVSLLGGAPTKIIDKLEGNFSISTDDSQIAFIRKVIKPDGGQEYLLMVAGSDGAGERTVLARTYPESLDNPLWSPDNKSILCAYSNSNSGGQSVSVVEVKVADGVKIELASERFFHVGKMGWLPRGDGLIMTARKNDQDNEDLWQVSYPAFKIRRITEGLSPYVDLSVASGADKAVASEATILSDIWVGSSNKSRSLKRLAQAMGQFCWTPGGRLVYKSMASGNRDLWIMQLDGAEQRQLTNDPGIDASPSATLDNRYIVFTSNRTGTSQLWRMNLDGSNQIQLTDGASKDFAATSPDGKWVIYNTTDDWHLWKVSIDGGDPLSLTDYPASYPSLSPDGKMIACLQRSEPKRELSIILLSFGGGEPLRKIEFTGGGFSGYRIEWAADGKALIYAIERNGQQAIIRQSLDGSPAEEVTGFGEDTLFDFGYSADGQSFALTRGSWQHDVVLISDLNQL